MSFYLDKHTAYYNLSDALHQPGCAFCRLIRETEHRYIEQLLYGDVTDVELRHRLRAARGFCAHHAAYLHSLSRALGVAIIYQDLLQTLLRRSSEYPKGRRTGAKLARSLEAQEECPACWACRMAEEVYIGTLIEHLDEEEFLDLLAQASPICLPHLLQILRANPSPSRLERLLRIQRSHWQSLVDELGEFIRKNDHRFIGEEFGNERDSWRRAVDLLAGRIGGEEG